MEDKTKSEISIAKIIEIYWNNLAPIKFVIDDIVIWDDYFYDVEALKGLVPKSIDAFNELLLNNEKWKDVFAKEIVTKIVGWHHSEVYIYTNEYKGANDQI